MPGVLKVSLVEVAANISNGPDHYELRCTLNALRNQESKANTAKVSLPKMHETQNDPLLANAQTLRVP